jgi:hypothetical protein
MLAAGTSGPSALRGWISQRQKFIASERSFEAPAPVPEELAMWNSIVAARALCGVLVDEEPAHLHRVLQPAFAYVGLVEEVFHHL